MTTIITATELCGLPRYHFEMGPFSLQTIRQNRGYHDTPADNWTYIPVVIIGGGQSGIAMGCRLKEALGFDQFRIFERQGGVGGTWYINRYLH